MHSHASMLEHDTKLVVVALSVKPGLFTLSALPKLQLLNSSAWLD